jgi:DNA-binding winged helix-turn-helix (wHTH) protein/tetratricopeptide (TPR) repeat protein
MAKRTDHARSSTGTNPVRVRFDRFELDEANARLLRDGTAVPLAPTPFAVLCALVRQPGSLLTTNALLDDVWGHQFVTDSVLRTAISELRTALDDDARKPRFIETVSRRGYRFIAAPSAIAAAPGIQPNVPGLATVRAPYFIGRAEPLSRLRRAWDIACSGKREIVWIAGEPGIGKTTLIEQFIASRGDVACARGQCVEQYGTGEPYLPVLEALEELCRSDGEVPSLLRAVAPTWLLQLPWLSTTEEREALRRELVGVSPDRMLREMSQFLDRYSERHPLLLVTEDLHWSDRATIQLIDYIARRRGGARLMWLASFRLAEVVALDHPLNSLRHELRLHDLSEEIVLDPFSESEVADYVAERSPASITDEAFVRTLYERTDGLPLFVASVLTEVIAGAAQPSDDAAGGSRLAKIAVPDNLAAIIDHYIAKLTSDQRLVLSAASVCGVEFCIDTISAALERDAIWIGQLCDELAREQLWLVAPRADEGGNAGESPYSFRHALFRQVLYERTNPSVRSHLHCRVGTTLERERAAGRPVAAAELAMHFELGREPIAALRCYVDAAEAALGLLSPRECLNLTEHALTLLGQAPEGSERDGLEIALATLRGISATHVHGISHPEAKSAFQRAYSLLAAFPEHPMRRRLLHGFGFVLGLRADYAEALAVAEQAEELSSATNDQVLLLATCIVHGEVDQVQGRSRAAGAWIERGLAVAEPLELAPGEIFVADPQVTLLGLLGMYLLHSGFVEQGRARLQRAHTRARLLGWPNTRLAALWFDALFEVRLGNAERVAALADEMRALVDESEVAQGRNACRWFRGWADARLGSPRDGYRRIREAYEDNTRLGMLAGGSEVLGYATEALVLDGDWDGAQQELEGALQVANTLGERVYLPQLFMMETAISRARGDRAAADAAIRRAIAEARAQEAPWLELMALIDLCDCRSATAKDRRALAALVDQLPEAVNTPAGRKARALLDKTQSV